MTENQYQPPTREQIAEAQAQLLRQIADEWAADPAAWGDSDRDYRNELRDRADALLSQPTPEQECAAHVVDPASNTRGMCPVCWPGFGEHGQQPTPSEVEVEGSFFAVADLPDILARHMRALDEAHRREKQHWIDQHEQQDVNPVTMAVGTKFTAVVEGGTQRSSFERVESIGGGFALYEASTGHYWNPAALDPSTICDVTPPPATPEAGR